MGSRAEPRSVARRAALACAAALWAQGPAAAQELPTLELGGVRDVTGEGLARLVVESPRASVFAGERLELWWTIRLPRAVLEERLVQLFRRALDVPVQVQPPALHGLVALGEPFAPALPGPSGSATLAFGERIVGARRALGTTLDGEEEVELRVARAVRALAPGTLVLEPSLLRFAYATAFREDFLLGSVPADRVEAYVKSEPLALEVLALPEEGRGPAFSGVVGTLSVEASAAPRELRVGEALELVLELTGDGDLGLLRAPRIEPASGLLLRGVLREEAPGTLRLRYDLAPTSTAVRTTPRLAFEVFDPRPPGRYRTIESPVLALRVLAASEPAPPAEAGEAPEPADAGTGGSPAPAPRSTGTALALGAGLALAAALGLVLARRRARARGAGRVVDEGRARTDAGQRSRRHAAAALFRERVARGAPDLQERSEAFSAFVAALLDDAPGAAHAHDLARRLCAVGIEPELARRTARAHDELVAARYGGQPPRTDDAQLLALADELARS